MSEIHEKVLESLSDKDKHKVDKEITIHKSYKIISDWFECVDLTRNLDVVIILIFAGFFIRMADKFQETKNSQLEIDLDELVMSSLEGLVNEYKKWKS